MKFLEELLIESHSNNYDAIVELVSNHFIHYDGCEVIIQEVKPHKSNIIVQWGKPELLINVHLDTVVPSDGWNSNPYTITRSEEKLIGLGICDTKSNIYAISEAIQKVKPNNLMLLFSVDEESNGIESGVTFFLQSGLANNIKRAIICEPTNNCIANFHKGYYSFYLRSRAESRHSSESEFLFDNAIYKISKYFEELIKAGYNLGKIEGGLAGNIIASECKFIYLMLF